MTKDQLKEYLRESLSVKVSIESSDIIVKLFLEGQEISSSYQWLSRK